VDGSNAKDVPHLPVINAFAERAKQGGTKVVVATGADSELGRKMLAARGFQLQNNRVGYDPYTGAALSSPNRPNRTVIRHVVGADIDSAADRLLTAYRDNKFIAEAWGGFDSGGYQGRTAGANSVGLRGENPENSNSYKGTRRRIERQISDFVTWWYPDRALATWGLSNLFPDVDGKPAWTLQRKETKTGEDTSEHYYFKFTPEGSNWLRQRLIKDSRGRNYGRRIANRLYGRGQLVRP
jgi:hypothetical protein